VSVAEPVIDPGQVLTNGGDVTDHVTDCRDRVAAVVVADIAEIAVGDTETGGEVVEVPEQFPRASDRDGEVGRFQPGPHTSRGNVT
jgi:hypothetical protein